MVLIELPPYSPELNPVERLWEDPKSHLDVLDPRVRSSLNGLRDHMADLIHGYRPEEMASPTGYVYLVKVRMHSRSSSLVFDVFINNLFYRNYVENMTCAYLVMG